MGFTPFSGTFIGWLEGGTQLDSFARVPIPGLPSMEAYDSQTFDMANIFFSKIHLYFIPYIKY